MLENYNGEVYGQFHLAMPIQKTASVTEDGETKMVIAGVASGASTDLEADRMTPAALGAFQKAVEVGIVDKDGVHSHIPLRTGHRKEWSDILGWVTKATVDDDNNLWIEAELDETSSIARDLFHKLKVGSRPGKPLKLGFSVGGFITKARKEYDTLTKRAVRVIEDVLLDEISVVGSPAYAPSFLDVLTKSTRWEDVPTTYHQGEDSMSLMEVIAKAKEEVRAELEAENALNLSKANANEQSVEVANAGTVSDQGEPTTQGAPQVAVQNGEEVLVPNDNSETTTAVVTQTANDNVNTDNVEVVDNAAAAVDDATQAREAAADEARAQAADANAQGANVDTNASSGLNPQEGALKELQDQVRSLSESIAQLMAAQQSNATPVTKTVEVEAASSNATAESPVEQAEVLTKSTQDYVVEAVTNALVAFKEEFLDPMTTQLQKMESTIDQVAKTPMDKSIAVESQTPRTTVEEFRKRLTTPSGLEVSPIRASIAASLSSRES